MIPSFFGGKMYTKITSSFYIRKINVDKNVSYRSAVLTVYGRDENNEQQYLKSFSERILDKDVTIPDITKMMLRKRYNDWLKVFKQNNTDCETPKEVIDKCGSKFVSNISTDSKIKKRGYKRAI